KVQARALIDAAAGRTLRMMFPMVSEPWEFDEARTLVEAQLSRMVARGHAVPKKIEFGCMLEVPALAESLDLLLPRIDFLSIGTNDLTQFLFAADRANPKLADRYDWLSVSLLRFVKRVSDQARAARRPVTVCGEMGGRPLDALALLGIGIERLSITPAGIGPMKAMIRSLALAPLQHEMEGWLRRGVDVRAALTEYASSRGIAVG
ncbi:MAG: peptidase, partial [Sphingomonadaceae bacterium]|nr:peptidase [Sphingomonadaceae bacterium]